MLPTVLLCVTPLIVSSIRAASLPGRSCTPTVAEVFSVPLTAAKATSANVWRYLLGLAEGVCEGRADVTSANGCVVAGGEVTHPEVLRHIAMRDGGLADAV